MCCPWSCGYRSSLFLDSFSFAREPSNNDESNKPNIERRSTTRHHAISPLIAQHGPKIISRPVVQREQSEEQPSTRKLNSYGQVDKIPLNSPSPSAHNPAFASTQPIILHQNRFGRCRTSQPDQHQDLSTTPSLTIKPILSSTLILLISRLSFYINFMTNIYPAPSSLPCLVP